MRKKNHPANLRDDSSPRCRTLILFQKNSYVFILIFFQLRNRTTLQSIDRPSTWADLRSTPNLAEKPVFLASTENVPIEIATNVFWLYLTPKQQKSRYGIVLQKIFFFLSNIVIEPRSIDGDKCLTE